MNTKQSGFVTTFQKSQYGFDSKKNAELFLTLKGFTKDSKSGYHYLGNQSAKVRKQVNGITFRIDFYKIY